MRKTYHTDQANDSNLSKAIFVTLLISRPKIYTGNQFLKGLVTGKVNCPGDQSLGLSLCVVWENLQSRENTSKSQTIECWNKSPIIVTETAWTEIAQPILKLQGHRKPGCTELRPLLNYTANFLWSSSAFGRNLGTTRAAKLMLHLLFWWHNVHCIDGFIKQHDTYKWVTSL